MSRRGCLGATVQSRPYAQDLRSQADVLRLIEHQSVGGVMEFESPGIFARLGQVLHGISNIIAFLVLLAGVLATFNTASVDGTGMAVIVFALVALMAFSVWLAGRALLYVLAGD